MLRRPAPTASHPLIIAAAGLLALVLAGCDPTPAPTTNPSDEATLSASPSPSAVPEGPVLVPEGTAADNLPLFTAVTEQVWASDQRGAGRAYIDALIAAGFDRVAMQVTNDQSTVGNAAESLQFSVSWGTDECLIGQVGPSTGAPVTAVMPQLAEGRCLIGSTRPIDW
ncbi:DUF6993 domain-containing protein [Microbacterium sp.]|uniref:DUF6993 domain-containing protein n=1 Tax=Microbacterium sp. TaxID=51671 RepID=UPI0039E64FBB